MVVLSNGAVTKFVDQHGKIIINLYWSFGGVASVEKSTFGIQTGVLGIWAHREVKLSNQIALRAELGMDAGIWGGSFYPKTGYLMTPVITFEPRWYYNLNKRVSRD